MDISERLKFCCLLKLDPWDLSIMYYLNPDYYKNWAHECVAKTPKLTWLLNGYIYMDIEAKKNGTNCEFRFGIIFKKILPEENFKFKMPIPEDGLRSDF